MKLASFIHNDKQFIGVAAGDQHLLPLPDTTFGSSMLELINKGKASLQTIRDYQAAQAGNTDLLLACDQVQWLAPVPNPGKVCGVAMNNSASNARKISAPNHPAFFLKPASCLVGHNQPIIIRRYYGSVHPEPELAVVIGRTGRAIAPDAALDHVFGYTNFNDITGNGMRAEDLFRYYALYPKKDNPEEIEKEKSDCF